MTKNLSISSAICMLTVGFLSGSEPEFKVHTIQQNSPLVRDSVSACTLADLDGDGDLDWTVATIWTRPLSKRTLYWFEYQSADKWIQHEVGRDVALFGAICTLDINGDDLIDIAAPNLWINKGKGAEWEFIKTGIGDGASDIQSVDIDLDGTLDLLVFSQTSGLCWYKRADDPKKRWQRQVIAHRQYAGYRVFTSGGPKVAGDLDGDGDIDIAAVSGWFQNTDGKGGRWKYQKNRLFPSQKTRFYPRGFGVKTIVHDIDRDGDLDIIQSECTTRGEAGIVWLENLDGKGDFKLNWIKPRSFDDFHSLALLDYDLDGDMDVLSATGPMATSHRKNLYLFENLSEDGDKAIDWKEHVIYSGMPIHEACAGDIDQDGDPDIVIKPWNKKDNSKDFLFLENITGKVIER